jgi:hypothetical protein
VVEVVETHVPVNHKKARLSARDIVLGESDRCGGDGMGMSNGMNTPRVGAITNAIGTHVRAAHIRNSWSHGSGRDNNETTWSLFIQDTHPIHE